MPRSISPFKIGLFVVICGSLALAAIIWLGASHYFEKTKTYVSYFDESVKGLQKDAVVNYRGVGVGRVAAIRVAPDWRLIEVLMDLKAEFKVHKDMAIQLREQGLTGLRYLEIDTAPADIELITPKITFPLKYPLIPSYPSEIEQLKNALETIYGKISTLDLQGLVNSWTLTAQNINTILAEFQGAIRPQEWVEMVAALRKTAEDAALFMNRLTQATSQEGMTKGFENLAATLEATRQTAENLARQIESLPPHSLAKLAKSWEKAATSGGSLFTSTNQRIGQSVDLLQQDLQQLHTLLTQLTELARTLKEQPNRLIFPPNAPNPFKRK